MRHDTLFYKIFPPPKFLTMPYAGLEIADDALRCIEYDTAPNGLVISKYASAAMPPGVIESGDIADEAKFVDELKKFVKDNKLSYVKVSLPEEKVYLFQTDIPSTEVKDITQHVEFKLEENVPISAADAVFYFDILPPTVTGNALRASVSVAPKKYVEKMLKILHELKLTPMAFEVMPKSIDRAVVPKGSDETYLIIHIMAKKVGTYIVSGGVVCFSSTMTGGPLSDGDAKNYDAKNLAQEIHRINSYWQTRPDTHSHIHEVLLVGKYADVVEKKLTQQMSESLPPLHLCQVWRNAFDIDTYVPPLTSEESMEFVVAAGLALP